MEKTISLKIWDLPDYRAVVHGAINTVPDEAGILLFR